MRNKRKYWLLTAFLIISIGLTGQENKSSSLSYSFSYIPPYLISSEEEFFFFPIYTNFEANIHYKPFYKISFTSGLGFFVKHETQPDYTSSSSESTRTNQVTYTIIRVPLQFNYHLIKSPVKTDSYLKAVYTNGLYLDKVVRYENEEKVDKDNSSTYLPSIGIGLGGIFLKHKPVSILLEGTIEKYIRYDDFTNSTWYSLKIGIII